MSHVTLYIHLEGATLRVQRLSSGFAALDVGDGKTLDCSLFVRTPEEAERIGRVFYMVAAALRDAPEEEVSTP